MIDERARIIYWKPRIIGMSLACKETWRASHVWWTLIPTCGGNSVREVVDVRLWVSVDRQSLGLEHLGDGPVLCHMDSGSHSGPKL